MKNEITGAQAILRRLEQHQITTIFGIPGGNILPIYDALTSTNINHVLAKHEQGAGFMAQGMARSTGKPAVCMATSGPGATNLITAISDAWSDSVPLIAITGQVSKSLSKTDAFQEVDIVSMVQTITKKSYCIESATDIIAVVDEAFELAMQGRPGPVLIDIPKDVQLQKCIWHDLPVAENASGEVISGHDIDTICRFINDAIHPIIIAGHGAVLSGASSDLCRLAEKQHIPVVTTLHGIGAMPSAHPLNAGMAGMHGSKTANRLLSQADLILALGIRFDDRLTGNINEFCPSAKVVHIDISARELNRLKAAHYTLKASLADVLYPLCNVIGTRQRSKWMDELRTLKQQYEDRRFDDTQTPEGLIRAISKMTASDTIVTTDVGQHQMWVAQSYLFNGPHQFHTSGGQGTMGFGLPAAIGAAMAYPHKQVICFTGDGSVLMNIQELATLGELGLNVKIIILNNSGLGMVRQQQNLFYNNNLSASLYGKSFHFAAVAKAFGISSAQIDMQEIELSKLNHWLSAPGPAVLDLTIDTAEMVTPMMVPGRSVHAMMDCEKEVEVVATPLTTF